MAGVSRLQYTTETRLIRVMCSGRIDPEFVLRAFLNGMDGALIGGCRLGECNYITHGNHHALCMTMLCKKIMARMGLSPDRLKIAFMSSGDGISFARLMTDFGAEIQALGPLGKGEGLDPDKLKSEIKAVSRLVPYIKIAAREKLKSRFDRVEDAAGLFTSKEVDRLIDDAPSYYIDPKKCQACMICLKRCPTGAVDGGKNRIHVIDQEKCIKCGACLAACPERFGAVEKISGAPAPPPIPEEKRVIVRKKAPKGKKTNDKQQD
jgi:F420-non-reducing hydrogenase iron-sulfur subunit